MKQFILKITDRLENGIRIRFARSNVGNHKFLLGDIDDATRFVTAEAARRHGLLWRRKHRRVTVHIAPDDAS